MDDEFLNPRREYRLFRPRQAQRGMKASGTPTNTATISLYNNSTGRNVLMVRDFILNGTANATIVTANVRGQVGSSQGLVTPILASERTPPGLLASIDTTTIYPGDYAFELGSTGTFTFWHEFPFAVIQIGWSLVFQATTSAQALTVSALWEAIEIDQLDYFY